MAEGPSAKTNYCKGKSGVVRGWVRERVWVQGHNPTGPHSVLNVPSQGRGGSGELGDNPRAQGSTALARVVLSVTEAYSGGCFPNSETFCLCEGWGKKNLLLKNVTFNLTLEPEHLQICLSP